MNERVIQAMPRGAGAAGRNIGLTRIGLGIAFHLVAGVMIGGEARGQIRPERAFIGVNQPVIVTIGDGGAGAETPAGADAGSELEVRLLEAGTGAAIERASVATGRADLAALFPTLWTTRAPRVVYAQVFLGERAIGPALALAPMVSPRVMTDGLTAALLGALERRDRPALERILAAGEANRDRLRQSAVEVGGVGGGGAAGAAGAGVMSGLRAQIDREVILDTTAGALRLRLRFDSAPVTAMEFLRLVEGGFHDGTPIHRIVNSDARGRPFVVQAGDPTGTGAGGPGYRVAFEPSTLRHDFGVVSMARLANDPNSAGSQFFICLGREACASLDGQYASFAEVIEGAETLLTLAATPVGPASGDDAGSARERPLDPPMIVRARAVDAAPYGTGAMRITRGDGAGVAR